MRIFSVAASLLLLTSAAPSAHHSFGAEYDDKQPITITGVVTRIEWTNPHSYVFLDVKDASGQVTNWKFEGYPPGVLYRTGWKRNATMKTGDGVTLLGGRARNGANGGHSRKVTFADGSKFYFGPPAGTGDG